MTRDEQGRRGRTIALIIAGTGLFWIAATALGAFLGLTQRTRALFDLAALAGFGFAIYMLIDLWRARRKDED